MVLYECMSRTPWKAFFNASLEKRNLDVTGVLEAVTRTLPIEKFPEVSLANLAVYVVLYRTGGNC